MEAPVLLQVSSGTRLGRSFQHRFKVVDCGSEDTSANRARVLAGFRVQGSGFRVTELTTTNIVEGSGRQASPMLSASTRPEDSTLLTPKKQETRQEPS